MASIVAYYSGATVAPVLPDESGSGNSGTLVGGTAIADLPNAPGSTGAIHLADAEYISSAVAHTGPWSVSFWWYPGSLSGTKNTIWSATPGLFGLDYREFDAFNKYLVLDVAGVLDSISGWSLQFKSYLWVITYDGTDVAVLQDGVEVLRVAAGTLPGVHYLAVKGSDIASGENFPGDYDEIAVWDGVLTPAQISALQTQTPLVVAPPPPPPPPPPPTPTQPNKEPGVLWRITLTGAADGTSDVLLPVSSIQARLRSGSNSYLSAVIPYTATLAAALADRPSGDLVLEHVADSVTTIVTVPLDNVQPVRGVNSASINITGWRQSTNSTPASHNIQPTVTTTGADGKRSWSTADFDPAIRPADTINFAGDAVVIDTLSMQISIGRTAVQYSEV